MTNRERSEAMSIVNKYKSVNEKLERLLSSIEKINEKKERAIEELEDLKRRELEFVKTYKKKYGESSNVLLDLQRLHQ